jgi:hypothetical protein
MTVDSVAGNVHDLGGVLEAVREMTGLKPFLRFELELAHGVVPVAQVMCGGVSLEFLEHAQGQLPAGAGHVNCVILEMLGLAREERELEPGLRLAVRPGPKSRLAEIQVLSGAVDQDQAVLQAGCGAGLASTGEGDGLALQLGSSILRLSPLAEPVSPQRVTDVGQGPLGQWLPGWHRIGLACKRLEEAVSVLVQAGGQVEVPPYQVLPGLREAMLRLPLGLVVQPVEQKLWMMLPAFGVGALMAKLAHRPLQFRTKEV